MSKEAKFPKGEKMTVDEVAAVVGDAFKEMNENPPESVLRVREEMQSKSAGRQRLTWSKESARYSNDPYWLIAKYPGKDKNGKPFKKGDRVFYYPLTKTILTGEEAEKAARDFNSHAFDDDFGFRAAATGLYGYTKATQKACESASTRLARTALAIAKKAFAKDGEVVSFLQAHARRQGSRSAKVLLAALKEVGPKIASEMQGGRPKEAGAPVYGLYGFKDRTATLGMDACKELRIAAGRIAADMHHKKVDDYEKVTGFLKEHTKQGKCAYAGMLLSCYPEVDTPKVASQPPVSVGGWLEWE